MRIYLGTPCNVFEQGAEGGDDMQKCVMMLFLGLPFDLGHVDVGFGFRKGGFEKVVADAVRVGPWPRGVEEAESAWGHHIA